MTIDYQVLIGKLGQLSSMNSSLVDMSRMLESGSMFGMSLTADQVIDLQGKLKNKAKDLKDLAQEIKVLTG